jgi:rRNA processing protein Krr1/Pno1
MKCIGRIIGKGGETLKKIRQTSGALVDIYTDRENGQEIAVLSGPSVNAVDIAELEIGKLLRTFAPTLIENKKEDPIDDTLRPQFPPGYSDNFYKANLRYSQKPQMINSFSDPSLTHDESTRDTYYQTDYNHSFPFDSSQTSTLCDGLKWHTIKGGKAIEGEQVTKNSKKKKNKKKNGARNAPLDPVVV